MTEPNARTTGPDGPAKAWDGILKVAGAVAGIAVLLYFVGAVTLWARFKAAGLPADKAVEHQPRGELIALGVRGTAVVLAVLFLLLAMGYVVLFIAGWLQRRRDPSSQWATSVTTSNPLDLASERVTRISRSRFHWVALLGLVVLLIAAWASWRSLAAAIVVVVFVGVSLRYLHQRAGGQRRPALWMIIAMALATGAAGICWQVEPPVLVQTVIVTPPPCTPTERLAGRTECDELKNVPIPYLGESDAYVFVAEIRDTKKSPDERYDWRYTKHILELPRNNVTLTFLAERGTLSPSVPRPLRALWGVYEALP